MSNDRKYVGARYVPLFMGEWDNSNTYEPLSIVLHDGNSYTSRQFVPAGVAITNRVYWAETGNYNAQIEQYRQEVQQLQANINNAANCITPLLYGIVAYDYHNEMQDHPGAICDVNGTQILVSSKDDSTNLGHWRTIDIANNMDNWDTAITAQLYHANSIAYDENNDRIIIAPVFDYSTTPASRPNYLLSFATNGDFIENILIPENCMGVSFDHENGVLYAYCYTTGNVYEVKSSNECELKFTIGYDDLFNQDFAVKGDDWYLSSPSGFIKQGSLSEGTTKTVFFLNREASKYFRYAELDGMEFTENGNLLALVHTTFTNNSVCGIIDILLPGTAELVVSNKSANSATLENGMTNFTANVIQSSKKLREYAGEMKMLEYLSVMPDYFGHSVRLDIKEDYTSDVVYITNKVVCSFLNLYAGVTVYITDSIRLEQNSIVILTAPNSNFLIPCPLKINNGIRGNVSILGSGLIGTTNNTHGLFADAASGFVVNISGGMHIQSGLKLFPNSVSDIQPGISYRTGALTFTDPLS